MNDSFWWLAILSRTRVRRPTWFFPLIAIFIIGVLVAGVIYAGVVFHAISERSHTPHVNTHSKH